MSIPYNIPCDYGLMAKLNISQKVGIVNTRSDYKVGCLDWDQTLSTQDENILQDYFITESPKLQNLEETLMPSSRKYSPPVISSTKLYSKQGTSNLDFSLPTYRSQQLRRADLRTGLAQTVSVSKSPPLSSSASKTSESSKHSVQSQDSSLRQRTTRDNVEKKALDNAQVEFVKSEEIGAFQAPLQKKSEVEMKSKASSRNIIGDSKHQSKTTLNNEKLENESISKHSESLEQSKSKRTDSMHKAKLSSEKFTAAKNESLSNYGISSKHSFSKKCSESKKTANKSKKELSVDPEVSVSDSIDSSVSSKVDSNNNELYVSKGMLFA